jgi:hypothetical protein
MLDRLDWKFFIMLILTAGGLIVPIWLWQYDLSSKALTLTIKSTAELQPQGVALSDGIEISWTESR